MLMCGQFVVNRGGYRAVLHANVIKFQIAYQNHTQVRLSNIHKYKYEIGVVGARHTDRTVWSLSVSTMMSSSIHTVTTSSTTKNSVPDQSTES
jgi:hypothetical protein